MKNLILVLSVAASLTTLSLSANALSQGGSGLTSMTHSTTNNTSTFTGIASTSTNPVSVIQPMVQTPKVINGKASVMGSAINCNGLTICHTS